MLIEQTKIAHEKLGISMNAFRRILIASRIIDQFTLIDGKRHYDYEIILEVIKKARNG